MTRLLTILVLIINISVFSQNKSVISGTIINKENQESLPFTSISLKNHSVGTISNENGVFDFYIPKSMRNDTLVISFIGFNSYEIPVSSAKSELKINLQPSNNVLDEVIISSLNPLDYIKKALENIEDNYPQNPYQTLAYYREKFIENGAIINKEEAVFKTYYPSSTDSAKNQHQLLLYKPEENPQQFQFMREWFEKKQDKRRKKAIKKGGDFEEEEFNSDIDMDLGGPESVINLDINNSKERGNYLKPKHFSKYEYTFGEETSLNGEVLISVNFKAKKKIEYQKDWGKILIHKDTYAIVLIEETGKFSIPFIIKPILFTVGLKIGNPTFSKVIQYQKYNNIWYPKLFRWDAKINLTKRNTFDANENSEINIGQVFSINEINSDAKLIPTEKLFKSDKEMENQEFNDINISWDIINVIKD